MPGVFKQPLIGVGHFESQDQKLKFQDRSFVVLSLRAVRLPDN
jgi:hypothetical protein